MTDLSIACPALFVCEVAALHDPQAEADLKAEKELLQAALDELEKLKPVCVDSGMSRSRGRPPREGSSSLGTRSLLMEAL